MALENPCFRSLEGYYFLTPFDSEDGFFRRVLRCGIFRVLNGRPGGELGVLAGSPQLNVVDLSEKLWTVCEPC